MKCDKATKEGRNEASDIYVMIYNKSQQVPEDINDDCFKFILQELRKLTKNAKLSKKFQFL